MRILLFGVQKLGSPLFGNFHVEAWQGGLGYSLAHH